MFSSRANRPMLMLVMLAAIAAMVIHVRGDLTAQPGRAIARPANPALGPDAGPGSVAEEAPAVPLPQDEWPETLRQAEAFHTEGSFRLARELYARLLPSDGLPESMRRQATFGHADSLWRERTGQYAFDQARRTLSRAVEDWPADDRWRAEAAESLGDLINETNPWDQSQRTQMIEAWMHAVDFWGHVPEVDAARPRYVALNFKIAESIIERHGVVPLPRPRLAHPDILPPPPPDEQPWRADTVSWALRNVLRVSENPVERTRAYLLLGRLRSQFRYQVVPQTDEWRTEAEEYLKQAAAIEPRNEWTDDALWQLALFYQQEERFVETVDSLRRLLDLFGEGESEYVRQARQVLDGITRPQISISTQPAFAPNSYLPVQVNYRNLSEARIVVRRVQPDALIQQWRDSNSARVRSVPRIAGEEVVNQPVANMVDEKDYRPHNTTVYLEPLPAGIYQYEVQSSGAQIDSSPSIFFVTSTAAAAKHHELTSEVWVTAAASGRPIAGADVRLLYFYQRGVQQQRWREARGTTGDDGIVVLQREPHASDEQRYGQVFVLALTESGPASIEHGWFNPWVIGEDEGRPVLYAYTDRPAYRPNEPIHWKGILRFTKGDTYELPRDEQVYFRLMDARGQLIEEGLRPLDNWGTISGTFQTTDQTALGMLMLEVRDAGRSRWSQHVQLARLEEYKLPEFIVSVEPPDGQLKLGQPVSFRVRADYYFGGAVAGAEAQLVVHRRPFFQSWHPPIPYDWLYGGLDESFYARSTRMSYWPRYQPEEIVLQETVTLGEDGATSITIPAMSDEEVRQAAERHIWGYEYRVEARVTDVSRREVSGSGSIKVARTGFAAYLHPERYVYLPGDPVQITLRTLDPNDKPVTAEGLATIYRREYVEDKDPQQPGNQPGWNDTRLFTRAASTNELGKGTIEFSAEREGYFYVTFETRDQWGGEIRGETTVFVCSSDSNAIGYRANGVEIILDRTSYERGETAQVLIATARPGVAVWLGIEGETAHSSQVVLMDGPVKLVPIEIREDFEPNIYITAVAMYDFSGYQDQKMMLVPPTRRLLDVEVTTAKPDYRPGEEAEIEIRVRDHEGNPVSTQLSLGVADAAVWAIQSDTVGEIGQFFWGRQRGLNVQTLASALNYNIILVRPVEGKPDEYEIVRREQIVPAMEQDDVGTVDREMRLGSGGTAEPGRPMARNARARDFSGAVAAEAAPMMMMSFDAADESMAKAAGGEAMAEAHVRSDFRSTALWLANVVTDGDGFARTTVTWPDSLTTWKAVARAADRETRVGQVTHEVKTNKPIMIRPQLPRFFVEGDEATISAVINNNTTDTQTVQVVLEMSGLTHADTAATAAEQASWEARRNALTDAVYMMTLEDRVAVPAGAQRRVDWRVTADAPGTATVMMTALTPVDSDAVRRDYPVLEYGIEQFIAEAATIRESDPTVEKTITLRVPEDRREGSEKLTVWIEPTLARTMVNALPYLMKFPYGCTEQTVSRFVPVVIVLQTLDRLGLDRPELRAEAPKLIELGLSRLYDMQQGDGGWAWWATGPGDPFMTAYTLQALAQAREAGVEVREDVMQRAAGFLALHLIDFQDQHDMTAFALYAMATAHMDGGHPDLVLNAYNRLWPQRQELNAYTRALFALACHYTERTEWAETLVRNMRDGIQIVEQNGTAHWGRGGVIWRWSDGGVEATAFSLRALLAIDPDNELIDPAMRWLVLNRRGNRWDDTRETAIVISALADYITVRGEDRPDWTVEVRVNGELVETLTVRPGAVFDFEGQIEVPAGLLRSGENTVTITRRGTGVLYASAWLTYFTREEHIPAAGNEVFIQRSYLRTRMEPTLSGVYQEVTEPLNEGDRLESGDRIKVRLTIEALNHYEYLVIEDMKAAGMEPTELQSGWAWGGGGVSSHREFRDEKTAFFISHMPQGRYELEYELRAEVPGIFSAMPTQIHAMYVPEIRANSEGARITIEDPAIE